MSEWNNEEDLSSHGCVACSVRDSSPSTSSALSPGDAGNVDTTRSMVRFNVRPPFVNTAPRVFVSLDLQC